MRSSGISWTICKSFAPCSRQITMPAPHHSIFYRPDARPDAQPTASEHWSLHSWAKIQIHKQQKLQYINRLCEVKVLNWHKQSAAQWAKINKNLTRQMRQRVPDEGRRDDAGALGDSREHARPHCSPQLKNSNASTTSVRHLQDKLSCKIGLDKFMPIKHSKCISKLFNPTIGHSPKFNCSLKNTTTASISVNRFLC